VRYLWLLMALALPGAAHAAALPARPVFCVVTPAHVSVCNYTSKALCRRDAGMQEAVCEAAPLPVVEKKRGA
jgi:hypothetical protein